jgi:hypothetical protein
MSNWNGGIVRITAVLLLTIVLALPVFGLSPLATRNSSLVTAPPSLDMGGPDGYGYYFETTQDIGDTIRFSWVDPSSHSVLTDWQPNPDDGWTRVGLPFGFPFYGDTLDSIVVCSNGFLEFPTTLTSYINEQLPVSRIPGLIAVFWDDLSPVQSGSIRLWDDVTNHATVITWDNVVRFNTTETLSCQVILGSDGRIEVNILRAPAGSGSATIGIQGHSGDDNHFLEYVFDGAPVHHVPVDSTSIRFFNMQLGHDVGVLRAGSPQGWIPANSQMTVTATFKNFGLSTETFPVSVAIVHVHFPYDTAFAQTRTVTNLAPGDTAACYYGDWLVPPSADSWKVMFRTGLAGDEFAYNDSLPALTTSIPPAFGTVLESWDFPGLGDGMNLAGITFSPDSNRFYLAAIEPNRVFSFPVGGPETGLRPESLELQSFFGDDLIWGIARDPVQPGFWITHVSASGPGCTVARYAADGSFAGDTWDIAAIETGAWFAGIDIAPDGVCYATEVGAGNRIYQLDLAAKQVLGFLPGPAASWRACAYVGDRECFVLSGGWNQNTLYRLSSGGGILETASLPGLADLDVYRRDSVCLDSLVWAFATISNSSNTIQRISAGRVWAAVGLSEPPSGIHHSPFAISVFPNPCRTHATVRISGSSFILHPSSLSVHDVTGRLVLQSPIANRQSSIALDLRSLPTGIYMLTLSTPTGNLTHKLVVLTED